MSTVTPGSFSALSSQHFAAPQASPQPAAPNALFGGAAPTGPVVSQQQAPVSAPQGVPVQYQQPMPQAPLQQPAVPQPGMMPAQYQQPVPQSPYPQQPAAPYTPPVPPQYQQAPPQAPQQPAAPQYQQPAPPTRNIIDRLVTERILTPQEAMVIPDDWALMQQLLNTPSPAPPAATVPVTPAPSVPPQTQPAAGALVPQPQSSLMSMVQPMIASGAIRESGGFYTATTDALSSVAAALNAERSKQIQEAAAKQAADAVNPQLEAIQKQFAELQQQIQRSIPQPHDTWINQHREYLYVKDQAGQVTNQMTPAGQIYNNVWQSLAAKHSDPNVLHTAAAQAVESYWRTVPPVTQGQPAPQPTFMQAAAAAPMTPIPGFNMPGQFLSNQNAQQSGPPRTPQGNADWRHYQTLALSGSLPPV